MNQINQLQERAFDAAVGQVMLGLLRELAAVSARNALLEQALQQAQQQAAAAPAATEPAPEGAGAAAMMQSR